MSDQWEYEDDEYDPDDFICKQCNGTGYVDVWIGNIFFIAGEECPHCDGKGGI